MPGRHHAPALHYPVQRSRRLGVLLLACSSASLMALLAWIWPRISAASASETAPMVLAMLLWLLGSVAIARQWRRSPHGTLCWTGHGWQWIDGSAATGHDCIPTLAWDWQHAMLLRCQHATTDAAANAATTPLPQWLWLERQTAPARWPALRRAVYSHADGAEPAA
ncbi:hypothetical protein D8I35_17595 [Corticibacter populi]|uniref:Toxin CptA n=1 Tax=Corticibacter populi TaxID=1550736 RepID=A0A3M6QIS4_9BURK|nr:hypothetical protein [Corticibacter populi]RMX02990.1 hypothetical protein D8I35_17595 [Corticibacter populi]RZS33417.1 hypothetical protein EV687_1741 [Corticibacter populi]